MPKDTFLRLLHDKNALSPIDATLAGILILVRFLHKENAVVRIDVTLSGML